MAIATRAVAPGVARGELAMHRRYGLLILLSAIVVAATVYGSWGSFQPRPQLPFTVRWVDAHQALIEPIPGMTPASLRAGDRLDLTAQSRAIRIALVVGTVPASAGYPLVIERGAAQLRATVHPVNFNSGGPANWADWLTVYTMALYAAIALLALWRGHDRAAWGIAFWAMAEEPLAFAVHAIPSSDNGIALLKLLGYIGFALAARIGFYVMAESIAGSAVRSGARAWWRILFALILGTATVVALGGRIAVVTPGWAGLMQPGLQWFVPASYLVPIALLAASFRQADAPQRQRLRWMLVGSVVLIGGLVFIDVPLPLSYLAVEILNSGLLTLAATLFLYAVLRHRLLDITVVINRALVYALTTSFVLGLFALLESLIERTTLNRSAGLLLELAVPLGLGVALSSVHRRIEAVVDRFIFRRQYRAETALRRFGEDCGFIREPERLFALSVEEIARHTDAPQVALYERSPGGEGYVCRRQVGELALPETIPTDDRAFVGLRARNAELALHDTPSVLPTEAYAYPLMLRGDLLGALVVGERPGEHYATDERALLFHVAHEIGAALFALRAQELEARAKESEAMVLEVAARARESDAKVQASEAMLNLARAQAEARVLALEERARASEALLLKLLPAGDSPARP